MLNLTSAQPYSFTVDGDAYTLAPLTYNDISEFTDIQAADENDRVGALRDFMFKRADKRAQAAIGSLAIADVMTLFKDWAGAELGESSSSPES